MTLEAVAKAARVSPATVSRVLNNAVAVKESTRRRVLSAIEELGYMPNLHARSLAGGKTRSLGVVVSNLRNPFFVDVFVGMEDAARERGYEVVVEQTGYRSEELVDCVRSMLGRRIGGLALIVSEMDDAVLHDIANGRVPAVFYDVGVARPGVSNIRVAYEVGMHRTVQYLWSLGHRRIAFIGHSLTLAPLGARRRSFDDAVARYAGEVQSKTVFNADSIVGAMQAAHELLGSGFRPTAIVCVNDYMALGVMRAVQRSGLRVPEDISVSGFDNIEFAEISNPPLTTCNIPRKAIGRMCVDALLDEARSGREIVIEPELVVRDSTGVARADGATKQ